MKLFTLALVLSGFIVGLMFSTDLIGIVSTEAEGPPKQSEQKEGSDDKSNALSLSHKLYQEGNDLEKKGDPLGALAKYEASLEIANKLNDQRMVANNLMAIGAVYRLRGSYDKAMEYYQRALKTGGESADKDIVAQALNDIGIVYRYQGSYDRAIEYYQRALKIREELRDKSGIAQTLNNFGVVYGIQGLYSRSVESYQRAAKILEELGDRFGLAYVLNNLGAAYRSLGLYKEAVEHYQRALKIREELKHKSGIAQTLNQMGILFRSQGLYDQAARYYQSALKIRRELGAKNEIAETLHNIGVLYRSQRLYKKAIEYFQSALKTREEVGDRNGAAITLNNLGAVNLGQGSYEEAIKYYQKGLEISQEINSKTTMGHSLSGIGGVYLKLQDYHQATQSLQQALTLGEEIKDPTITWEASYKLAQVHGKLGARTQALKHYKLAIEVIEKVRARAASDEGKAGFLAERLGIYEDFIRFLYELAVENPTSGYEREAFEYSERAKARVLLDTLAEAATHTQKGLSESQRVDQQKILHKISQAQSQLRRENLSEAQRKERLLKLKQAEEELEQFVFDLKIHSPEYARLHYPEPYRLEQLQEKLQEDSVLLEFTLGEEQSFVFVITRADFRMAPLPKRAYIENQVKKYRQLIDHPPKGSIGQDPEKIFEEYHKRAFALFNLLLGPVREKIKGKRSLILVVDGILHYLPFETLVKTAARGQHPAANTKKVSRTHYLIEEHTIMYAPSASVWGNLKTKEKVVQNEKKELLAFGDPIVRRDQRLARGASIRGGEEEVGEIVRGLFEGEGPRLDPLSHTREEVEGISKLYPKNSQKVYLGEAATESRLKKEKLTDYKRIHFATHALIDEQVPRRSGVVLSMTEKGEEDGVLQMHEIFNLDMEAELVVLSACQTGLGKLVRGEGMISLVRGFLYAGAENVVVSLWNVDDKSTAEFMINFYKQMKQGKDKAQALRHAKLQMIRSAEAGATYAAYAYPYYWGAFILIGQGN